MAPKARFDELRASHLPPLDTLYWITLLGACAMGETAADLISHELGLGYLKASLLLGALFLAAMAWEFASRGFSQVRYWVAIAVTSTVGTTLADLTTRTLGLGYGYGSLLLVVLLAVVFATWRGGSTHGKASEVHYWAAILVASTMGTTLGDLLSNEVLGFGGSALLLAALLGLVFVVQKAANLSRELCYWIAVVLTSTFGAAFGDYLTKEEAVNLGPKVGTALLAAALAVILILRAAFPRETVRSDEPNAPHP